MRLCIHKDIKKIYKEAVTNNLFVIMNNLEVIEVKKEIFESEKSTILKRLAIHIFLDSVYNKSNGI